MTSSEITFGCQFLLEQVEAAERQAKEEVPEFELYSEWNEYDAYKMNDRQVRFRIEGDFNTFTLSPLQQTMLCLKSENTGAGVEGAIWDITGIDIEVETVEEGTYLDMFVYLTLNA